MPLDRAMELAPEAGLTWRARISYAGIVDRDRPAARTLAEAAAKRYPSDPDILRMLGGAQGAVGDRERAIATLRRAAALDPRNTRPLAPLAGNLERLGRWSEAREVVTRILILNPDDGQVAHTAIRLWLSEGNLEGARQALASARPGNRAEFLAYMTLYGDFHWLLDASQQDTLLGLPVGAFEEDAGGRALAFAQIFRDRGETAKAIEWARVARRGYEALDDDERADPQISGLIGLTFSYEGRHGEARRWLEQGVTEGRKYPATLYYNLELLARGLVMAGAHDTAITVLGESLETGRPGLKGIARLNPAFAPLRGNPRFEAMTKVARAPS